MAIGKRVVRGGVVGHIVKVTPRKGYERFVRHHYRKNRSDRD